MKSFSQIAMELQRKIAISFDLPEVVQAVLGDAFIAAIATFRKENEFLKGDAAKVKLQVALQPRIDCLFKPLLDVLAGHRGIFNIQLVGDTAAGEKEIAELGTLDIKHEYIVELVDFAKEIGEQALVEEVQYLTSAIALLRACVCLSYRPWNLRRM